MTGERRTLPRSRTSRTAVTLLVAAALLVAGVVLVRNRRRVGPGDLVADFDRLVGLVERTHPDPYAAFGGRDAYRDLAALVRAEVADAGTVAGLHALAQRFLATLRDGHTSMNALSDARGVPEAWGSFDFGVASDALYVRAAPPRRAEYVGARVLTIDALDLDAVVDSVRTRYPSENRYGGMDRLRSLLSHRRNSWPGFLRREGPLPLTVETAGGDTVTLGLELRPDPPDLVRRPSTLDLTGDNRLLYGKVLEQGPRPVGYFVWNAVVSREVADEAYRRDPSSSGGTFDWVFRYLPDATRTGDPEKDLLLMPSLYDRFSGLLREMEARGATHLIIDLRRNGGGMTPLVYTLLYMLYGDEVVQSDLEVRYDVRLSELYLARMGVEDIDEYNAGRGTDHRLGEVRRGYLFRNDLSVPLEERRRADELTFADYGSEYWEPVPEGEGYSPEVVVLTSASTFSAAFHFTYFLSEIGGATVVGVPPRQAPNAFMESTPFELPRTGLRGSISNAVQVLYPPDHPRAREFTPDFPMGWDDFRRYDFDPDAEVLFALDLIHDGRVPPGRGGP